MSFGLKDSDWVNPPEEPVYIIRCRDCIHCEPCPCGCGWGYCKLDEAYNKLDVWFQSDECNNFDPVEDFEARLYTKKRLEAMNRREDEKAITT